MLRNFLLFLTCLISIASLSAQTNPAPQSLPYSFTMMTPTIPAGMAIHRFGTTAGSIPTTRTTAPGNGDLPFGATSNQGGWHNHGADGVGLLASGTNAAGAIIVAINTVGLSNISVSWLCRTTLQQASRDNSIALQYRVGTSGNFIDVGTTTTYSSTGQPAGSSSPLFTEILPSGAENQPVVQVRWIYWESVSTSGSRDKIAVDEISITGNNANVTADRLTFSNVPPGATANTPFTVTICATNEAGQTQSDYSVPIALTQTSGTPAQITPASPQTPVNGCVNYTITPLVAGENISFSATSGSLLQDDTGPIPVYTAPSFCFDDLCHFEAVPVTLNENGTNWICNNGTYSINAYCPGCATQTNTWLISPDFTFTAPTPQTFLNFTLDQNYTGPALQVFYTNTYTGNPATTSWTSLGTASADGNYSFDLSSITGGNIQFGIQYTANGQSSGTALYNVSNLSISSVDCGNVYENNCAINEIAVNYLSTCDDKGTTNTKDDTRPAQIIIEDIIQGAVTGQIELLVNNQVVYSLPATGAAVYTIDSLDLPANNQQNVLKVRFTADTSCNNIFILAPQQSCSAPVALAFMPGFNELYYEGTLANVNVCYVDESGNKSPQHPLSPISLTDDPDHATIVSSTALPDNACYNFIVSMDTEGSVIFTASENTAGLSIKDTVEIQDNPCIIISEIVDPVSGNNKYVEIYNGGDGVADLTGYKLNLYRNGSTTIGTSFNVPSGTMLSPGQTFVFRNSAAGQDFSDCGVLQVTSSALDHNGNDAYELVQGDYIHDRFGVVGEDPAPNTSWNYADKIVTRNFNIQCSNGVFDLNQWTFAPYTAGVDEGTPCEHCATFTAGIDQNDTTVCIGTDLQLSATEGYSYQWSGPGGFSSTLQNPVITDIQESGAGTYYVSITNNEFCSPLVDSIIVSVEEELDLEADIDQNEVCIGTTVQLSVTGGEEYQWEGPGGFTSTEQNPQIQITSIDQAGIYTVVSANDCGIYDTATVELVVNEPFEVVATADHEEVCEGGSVQLDVTEGENYSWTGPDGFTSALKNPVITDFNEANEGEYIVSVTALDPCNPLQLVTLSDTIVITISQSPAITVTATPNPVCTGGSFELSTTEGASYQWSGPGGFSSTLQNPVINNAQTAQSGYYKVAVTSSEGCSSVDSVLVTVNSAGQGTATATPNPACIGSVLHLQSSGGSNYIWSGPANFTSTSQNPDRLITSAAQAGLYSVTITTNEGCVTTASVNVQVNSTIIGIATASPEVACVGSDVQLSASGGDNYSWSGPQGFTSNQANPVIQNLKYQQRGLYTVTITNNLGCSDVQSIYVDALYPPVAEVTYDLADACQGGVLSLHGSGGGLYSWSGPNGFTSGSKDPVIQNLTSANSGLYRLIVTSPNGCTDNTTLDIVVNATPVLTVNQDIVYACEGTSVHLYAEGSGSFLWTGPWGYTSNLQNPVIENIPGYMSGTYSVQLTGPTGCTTSTRIEIKVSYRIEGSISASDNPVCEGSSFQLLAEGGSNYLWTGPDGFFSTDQNPVIDFMDSNKEGTYGVLITNEGGCQDFRTVDIKMIPALEKAWANANPNPVNEGQSVQFTASTGVGYSWTGPGGFTSDQQNPVINRITRDQAGVYTVVIGNELGCPAIVKVILRVLYRNNFGTTTPGTILSDKVIEQGHVYPNPTTDRLYFEAESGQAVEYRIVNAEGREIVPSTVSRFNYIETGNLGSGVYYIFWQPSGSNMMKWSSFVKIK